MGNHIAKAARRNEKQPQIREAPSLPIEILLTIIARADPATLLRCAAASKLLRRHIADPAFHAELAAAGRGRGGGPDPSLLLGIFRQHRDGEPYRFVPVPPSAARLALPLTPPPPPPPPADDALLDSFEPVESRSGLVVLRRRRRGGGCPVELCVCSPVAGRCPLILLPPLSLDYYDSQSHVLLPGDEDDDSSSTGRRNFSFRLLVVNLMCRTQTFSSRTGKWGPVTEVAGGDGYWPVRPAAVVLRGVAHWLCRHDHQPPRDSSEEFFTYRVVSLRVDTTPGAPQLAGAAIEVPQRCLRRRYRYPAVVPRSKELLLVSTAEGRLGLLVAEIMAISIWVVPSGEDDSWGARRAVVDKAAMLPSVELRWELRECEAVEMEWFGEASGAVVLQVHGAGVLVLDLRTGDVVQVQLSRSSSSMRVRKPLRCCPYEVGLLPLLASISAP